jgi:hypothetical protein
MIIKLAEDMCAEDFSTMENNNWGLSRRSDDAWKLIQIRENDPAQWDAMIQADLDVMKQPIFDNPYDGYDSIDDIPTDRHLAHGQLLANLSGDDTNPNDIWALAEGDYTALERLPEHKRDAAFRICDRLEESGEWSAVTHPDRFANSTEFPSTEGIWDDVPDLGYAIVVNPVSEEKTYTSPYQEYRGWDVNNQPVYDDDDDDDGDDGEDGCGFTVIKFPSF